MSDIKGACIGDCGCGCDNLGWNWEWILILIVLFWIFCGGFGNNLFGGGCCNR
jgi:hypothetical protein